MRRRYQGRQLGQLSGRPSFLNVPVAADAKEEESSTSDKTRSNSDDWLYTVSRKQQIHVPEGKPKARSLDWQLPNLKIPSDLEMKTFSKIPLGLVPSKESNNNLIVNK